MNKLLLAVPMAIALMACGSGAPELMDTSNPEGTSGAPYPMGSIMDGAGYESWAAEYSRVALERASAETHGARCFASQSEGRGVIFLGGSSYGAGEGDCHLPSGAKLFFPMISYQQNYPCDGDPTYADPEAILGDAARRVEDKVFMVGAEVDGLAIPNVEMYRASSRLFDFHADASQVSGDRCVTGQDQLGVADGWWLMMSPLAKGEHVVSFVGSQLVDQPWARMTYHLTVD